MLPGSIAGGIREKKEAPCRHTAGQHRASVGPLPILLAPPYFYPRPKSIFTPSLCNIPLQHWTSKGGPATCAVLTGFTVHEFRALDINVEKWEDAKHCEC